MTKPTKPPKDDKPKPGDVTTQDTGGPSTSPPEPPRPPRPPLPDV